MGRVRRRAAREAALGLEVFEDGGGVLASGARARLELETEGDGTRDAVAPLHDAEQVLAKGGVRDLRERGDPLGVPAHGPVEGRGVRGVGDALRERLRRGRADRNPVRVADPPSPLVGLDGERAQHLGVVPRECLDRDALGGVRIVRSLRQPARDAQERQALGPPRKRSDRGVPRENGAEGGGAPSQGAQGDGRDQGGFRAVPRVGVVEEERAASRLLADLPRVRAPDLARGRSPPVPHEAEPRGRAEKTHAQARRVGTRVLDRTVRREEPETLESARAPEEALREVDVGRCGVPSEGERLAEVEVDLRSAAEGEDDVADRRDLREGADLPGETPGRLPVGEGERTSGERPDLRDDGQPLDRRRGTQPPEGRVAAGPRLHPNRVETGLRGEGEEGARLVFVLRSSDRDGVDPSREGRGHGRRREGDGGQKGNSSQSTSRLEALSNTHTGGLSHRETLSKRRITFSYSWKTTARFLPALIR